VQVRDMLGLADKSAQRRLFAALLNGDGAELLEMIDHQFALGIEPLALLRAAMELTHRITVAQLGKSGADAVSAEERAEIEGWAGSLTAGQLHRLWQLLLKGYDEVRGAPDPLVSAKMALLRVQHASDLPDPGALAKKLEELAASGMKSAPASAAPPPAQPEAPQGVDWGELVGKVDHSGQLRLAQVMHDWVRVASLEPESLTYALAPGFPGDPTAELRDALLRATGQRWQVTRVEGDAAPSLREVAEAVREAERAELLQHPLVEAAMAAFPGAELIDDAAEARSADHANWRNSA
jgi:DNA polymerase-3 subunit gamma/tau